MTEGRNQSEPDAAEEKKPVYVHCSECDHQWVAFYTPLKMDANGMRLMTAAGKGPCPMCASGKPMMGPSMTAIRKEQATMTNRSIDERAGKRMPVNAEPVAHGNLEVTGDQCRVIKTHEVYTGVRYLSHFATCTKAAQFRKKPNADQHQA